MLVLDCRLGQALSAVIDETAGYIIVANKDGSVKYYRMADGMLLSTFYHVSEGFVWSTPPDDASSSVWFWTNRPDLIRVHRFDEASGENMLLQVGASEREEYICKHNRQDLVMSRLNTNKINLE